ncbi:unnamed protein product, partial [Symbiodinium pilosum]
TPELPLPKGSRNARQFDSHDLDRLMREGDPDDIEEMFGLDLDRLYSGNDEIIDQLDQEQLLDLEAFYRLARKSGLRLRCLSCCSGLRPACVVWDLTGQMHIVGHY